MIDFGNTMIKIKRTEAENEAIKEVSNCISELNLDSDDNNRLVRVLVNMLTIAEKEQFLLGFETGICLMKES